MKRKVWVGALVLAVTFGLILTVSVSLAAVAAKSTTTPETTTTSILGGPSCGCGDAPGMR